MMMKRMLPTFKVSCVLRSLKVFLSLGVAALFASGCAHMEPVFGVGPDNEYDFLILNGEIYDGSGGAPYIADIGVIGDRIDHIGNLKGAIAHNTIDAGGLAVAPGFINMLSWAPSALVIDGRAQSDIRQGVTLEVMGEGMSMGPLNAALKEMIETGGFGIPHEVTWTTLGEYFDYLEGRGVSPNVASFVGAATVRVNVLGYEDRQPDADELQRMRKLVADAMQEGAMGLSSALIYAPGAYAQTTELIELAKVAQRFGGVYISHIRSESNRIEQAIEEIIEIAESADIAVQIYHLKVAGKANWPKFDNIIGAIENARASGIRLTADMYPYPAGASGLDASMPLWVQEGGHDAWIKRLKDRDTRTKTIREMNTPSNAWENLFLLAGAEGITFANFRTTALRKYLGKTLAEVAAERGTTPAETIVDLVIEDDSRVGVIYFLMSEENVRRTVALPWVSFSSDAPALAPEGDFLQLATHPRAYGSFARVLGKYVREENVIPLREAIRRMTSFPAGTLGIRDRGNIKEGFFADIVVFDPQKIIDRATFSDPHQYATGVEHVIVNGVWVLKDGEHTDATPGRVIRGPGWGRP